ncbi:hypothetical protein EJ110_NYTH20783 [Nymphaea thermarum]|nr:hypothetical protein EJ110_NYTH20783 [Nymphaea thermarum]
MQGVVSLEELLEVDQCVLVRLKRTPIHDHRGDEDKQLESDELRPEHDHSPISLHPCGSSENCYNLSLYFCGSSVIFSASFPLAFLPLHRCQAHLSPSPCSSIPLARKARPGPLIIGPGQALGISRSPRPDPIMSGLVCYIFNGLGRPDPARFPALLPTLPLSWAPFSSLSSRFIVVAFQFIAFNSRTLNMHLSSKTLCLPLLVIIFFNHALLSKGSRHMLEGGKYYRNEVPITTITVDDGDIYDCMKLGSHPRKGNPSILRKIQSREKPSLHGTITTTNNSDHEATRNRRRKAGAFKKVSCPPGSFPVLKATKAGPLNFSAIESFASLRASSFLESKTTKPSFDHYDDVDPPSTHEVNPMVFGDRRTRFFAFTTNDDFNTFLYNDDFRQPPNNCLQFSRVDNYMPFGVQLDSSIIDGDHMELEIVILQDEDQDWVLFVDDTMIGFWPKSNYRARYANKISWGGEIINKQTRGRHTSTQMGNGHFSSKPIGKVAYIRKMALYNLDLDRYEPPEEINFILNNPDCYDVSYIKAGDDEDDGYRNYITFGGPGVELGFFLGVGRQSDLWIRNLKAAETSDRPASRSDYTEKLPSQERNEEGEKEEKPRDFP